MLVYQNVPFKNPSFFASIFQTCQPNGFFCQTRLTSQFHQSYVHGLSEGWRHGKPDHVPYGFL